MRGTYTLTAPAGEPAPYSLAAEEGTNRFLLTPVEVEDANGDRLAVQRLEDRVLFADPFTGRVSAIGEFITNNVCRPPAALAQYPDVRHYSLEAPGLGRTEYHLGRGPEGFLGIVLTPDGRRLARIESRRDAVSIEVAVELDWQAVLTALHLTIFEAAPRGAMQRFRSMLRRGRRR